ncbi:beta-1,3-galactosyltransferase 1 [Triplophysa dalaica]|uniref:beta-1,3-galactosyltransferase 1 n=1 Tax=Triplophysa dalaica TaxID=1582913 RepID=UPI0024DFA06F|nr:beta-1,3-galactosyltransferase 1 [Triplophysa dalaica]
MPKLSPRRAFIAVVGLSTVFAFLVLNNLYAPYHKKWTPISKELYDVISPSSYRYILNQPDLCEKKRPYLVLMIPVSLRETEARTAIRKTWGRESLTGVSTLSFFVIGQPVQDDPTHQQQLERESEEYGDIIQMDFLDTYQNLTIKTVMIMYWIATHCQCARYAMKIDADTFLNLPYLVNYLHAKGESSREGYISGSVIRDAQPKRNILSKWFLSEEIYPDTSYPAYLSGAAYVFSIDLASKIYLASRFVQPIPLEDVYVGLCLHVLGVQPVYSTRFFRLRNLFEVRKMKYDRCTFARRITVNGFKPQNLLKIWFDFQKARFTC